jgi:hypothetical protein
MAPAEKTVWLRPRRLYGFGREDDLLVRIV